MQGSYWGQLSLHCSAYFKYLGEIEIVFEFNSVCFCKQTKKMWLKNLGTLTMPLITIPLKEK